MFCDGLDLWLFVFKDLFLDERNEILELVEYWFELRNVLKFFVVRVELVDSRPSELDFVVQASFRVLYFGEE